MDQKRQYPESYKMDQNRQYADLQVNGIELNKDSSLYTEKDAVSKLYVDQKVSDLVSSAPQVLDTLKELADALGSDPNFGTTITTQIAGVQTSVDSEAARATAAEAALQISFTNDINTEASTRQTADSALSSQITQEVADRQSDVSTLTESIASEVDARTLAISTEVTARQAAIQTLETSVTGLSISKLDSSDKYSKGTDGHFKVGEDSFLYIGDAWRIRANNSFGPKKLQFEYSNDGGVSWDVGVPFIRG